MINEARLRQMADSWTARADAQIEAMEVPHSSLHAWSQQKVLADELRAFLKDGLLWEERSSEERVKA